MKILAIALLTLGITQALTLITIGWLSVFGYNISLTDNVAIGLILSTIVLIIGGSVLYSNFETK